MKAIGGPKNGEDIKISEAPDGPELNLPGMIIEYDFSDPGKVGFRLYSDSNPQPSLPGIFERYQCRDDAWHYLESWDQVS